MVVKSISFTNFFDFWPSPANIFRASTLSVASQIEFEDSKIYFFYLDGFFALISNSKFGWSIFSNQKSFFVNVNV